MEATRDQHKHEERHGPLRVAVVGHCASGKTTLVGALRRAGYDAYAVAQEHSAIAWLWKHADPSVLIYIDVPLATVRARRGQEWPEAVYDAQEERLTDARSHADLILDSSTEDIIAMTAHALDALSRLRASRGETTEITTNPS
jgi:hypothetical protein